jgi:hypothetical protein
MTSKALLLTLVLISLFLSCEKDNDNINTHELPSRFPLEVRNAWKYERIYYENGSVDTSYLDTLYIAGNYQDYFLYSWSPKDYYSLVKNSDNKLVNYGRIDPSDTTFYGEGIIWSFYGKSGCFDPLSYENYDFWDSEVDSFCISIEDNKEYFGEKWNTYVEEMTSTEYEDITTIYNRLGYVHFKYYDDNNILTSESIMIEKLENVDPPELSNDGKENKIKLTSDPITHLPY